MSDRTTDRDKAINWARTHIVLNEFVIVDVETTGLDSAAQIIEIQIIDHRGHIKGGAKIKPSAGATMDPRAFAVHGITLESLANAMPLTAYTNMIEQDFKGKTIIGWNVSFDHRMLVQSFGVHGDVPDFVHLANFECAMLQHAKYFGDWDERRGQYKWQKLPGGTHTALEDCRAVLAVMREMAAAKTSEELVSMPPAAPPIFTDTTFPTATRGVFEHGTGTITQTPAPDSTDDPAANGFTFNMFGDGVGTGIFDTTIDLLSLVGVIVDKEEVATWSAIDRQAAEEWATREYLAASDNEVDRLPRPTFLPQ